MSIHINPHAIQWPKAETWVHHLVISPDSKTLIGAGMDRRIHLWDIDTRKALKSLEGHSNSIRCLAMTSDGKILLSGADEGDIRMWELGENAKCLNVWKNAHKGAVRTIALSRDNKYCISGGDDGVVQMWVVETGQPIGSPGRRHTSPVSCVSFTDSGNYAGSGDEGGVLAVWKTENQDLEFVDFVLGPEALTCATAIPNEEGMLTSCRDTTILHWALNKKGSVGEPWRGHTDSVQCVGIFANAEEAVTGSADNTLRLWDIATGTAMGNPWKAPQMPIETLAIAPNNEIVISAGADEMWTWTWEIEIRPDHPDDVPKNEEEAELMKKRAIGLQKFAAKRPNTTFKLDEPLPPADVAKPTDAAATPSSKQLFVIAEKNRAAEEAKKASEKAAADKIAAEKAVADKAAAEKAAADKAAAEKAAAEKAAATKAAPEPQPQKTKAPVAAPAKPKEAPAPTPEPAPRHPISIPGQEPIKERTTPISSLISRPPIKHIQEKPPAQPYDFLTQGLIVGIIALGIGAGLAWLITQHSPTPSPTSPTNLQQETPTTSGIDNHQLGEKDYQQAMRFFQGKGVTQDYPQAIKLFRKSSADGNCDAKYYLGLIYSKGLGVKADPSQAQKWFQEAALNGSSEALMEVNKIADDQTKEPAPVSAHE